LEELEVRQVLSGFQPTAVEQLFLEQLNDARANPAAYGASIGVDLSGVAPSQPLAFSPQLIQSARLHSQDMNAQGYFAHTSPQGSDPGQRMTQAGFAWVGWGESIAGGSAYPGPSAALQGLIVDSGVPDLGHRRQLLAIDSVFQNQNQVGIGIVQAGSGLLTNYYTIDTAAAANGGPLLTGVVYADSNHNGKYDIGEGLAGVTISVAGVGSTTTFGSGGYSLAVGPGTYTVTASGGGLPAPITELVTVGQANARLNFVSGSPGNPASQTNTDYVAKFYRTILGRQASPAEVAYWQPAVQGPGGPTVVASAIEHSAEARDRLVKSWYATYLGRPAVNGEEQEWVNSLLQGVSEEDVLAAILGSGEFYRRTGTLSTTGTADERYVRALYLFLLKRTPSAGEVAEWTGPLATDGRLAVAAGFLHSGEYRADVVGLYYSVLLHRQSAPSAAEVAYWASSGLDLTDIRVGFEASNEFLVNG
jgi:hypothetical protein